MESPSSVPTTQWATAHAVPVRWMQQFRYFSFLYDKIRHLPGDVVECGVGEGNTIVMLAYLMGSESRQPPRSLWGFDSFEGFPEPSQWDASFRNPQKGEWHISEESVKQRFEESGIYRTYPHLDIRIQKGFLGKTLPNFPDHKIVFLHLDVDLYEGYRDGLEYLFPKVIKGGIVLFDEYREFRPDNPAYGGKEKWPGCSKAVDEYFANRSEEIQYYPETMKYFVVKAM
ncbi:MAG TPA: TylF/MycF/NovP-related O-methyltransferase [Candidatus Paceibacterota bacterium]|nr:TylF/MycF/NovP-related O-methyltransferase [Candidatus Paceibacterota bacterium]